MTTQSDSSESKSDAADNTSTNLLSQQCTSNKNGVLHQFFQLQQHSLYLTMRDPFLNEIRSANDKACTVTTFAGRSKLTPTDFMKYVNLTNPDIFTCMSDEVPAYVSANRARKSVTRSLKWLDQCIELRNSQQDRSRMFASIQGGTDVAARMWCVEEMVKRDVDGFSIGGFGMGESLEERVPLVSAIIEQLPKEKPRSIHGLGSPCEILEGVNAGVDLFESTYCYSLTDFGYASSFDLNPLNSETEMDVFSSHGDAMLDNEHASLLEPNPTKLNLRDVRYVKDSKPLLPHCSCFTCRNHSRAYIHHLLDSHEMNAQVLLQIHNVHHFMEFFRVIREHIENKSFGQFKDAFIEKFSTKNSV